MRIGKTQPEILCQQCGTINILTKEKKQRKFDCSQCDNDLLLQFTKKQKWVIFLLQLVIFLLLYILVIKNIANPPTLARLHADYLSLTSYIIVEIIVLFFIFCLITAICLFLLRKALYIKLILQRPMIRKQQKIDSAHHLSTNPVISRKQRQPSSILNRQIFILLTLFTIIAYTILNALSGLFTTFAATSIIFVAILSIPAFLGEIILHGTLLGCSLSWKKIGPRLKKAMEKRLKKSC